jgi:hypothetical protein
MRRNSHANISNLRVSRYKDRMLLDADQLCSTLLDTETNIQRWVTFAVSSPIFSLCSCY